MQYYIATNVLDTSIRGVLFQLPHYFLGTNALTVLINKYVVVSFISFQLTSAKSRYHTTEKEFLVIIKCLKELQPLVIGSLFAVKIYTNHLAITDILKKGDLATSCISRWLL